MEITPNTRVQTPKTRTEPEAVADRTKVDTDFDTFLKLLTTQLQNQDPLKPMESTEFVAQLASFSSVEQQVRTNERLEQIFEALGGGSSAGLASWIGREVRSPGKAEYNGAAVPIETTPLEKADRATLLVTNDFGTVVAKRDVDPKASSLSWDGLDALGNALPNGLYSFSVESYAKDDLIGTTPAEVYSEVTEVRIEDGTAHLLLKSGSKVGVSDVSALR